MTQEMIDIINQMDTAHYVTYLYGCIFIIAILLTAYITLTITFGLIIKKKKERFMENQNEDTRNKIREYNKIGVFTKIK